MKKKSDAEIRYEVLKELDWDKRTWNQDVTVRVDSGVVTLGGVVSSHGLRQAAQAAAHRVFGVTDVANDIFIQPDGTTSDSAIAHAVRRALEWDTFVPDGLITSTISGGRVKLEGRVNSLAERADVERAVENLSGVTGVINEIKVEAPKPEVKKLREAIEAALERRADREADKIRVELVDNHINLFGRVHSWPEREAVVGSISHARGVAKVNDYLTIDPYF